MTNAAHGPGPVAVLGTGIMGEPIARRLLRAGFEVRAWNRTRAKADPLAADGATVTDTAAGAVAGAAVVITMLTDADAVAHVMAPLLVGLEAGAIWAQLSTVGDEGADRLAALARQHGVTFVDAPVLGTRKPAEDGTLRVLASGPAAAIDRCRPLFEAMGSLFSGLGEAGEGSRLKLAVNQWVLTLTDATAASLALSERFGLDPDLFLAAIEGSPTDSPYAHVKGPAMLGGTGPVSFTLAGAAKDAGLIAAAGRRVGADTALIDAILGHLRAAVDAGHAGEDMAAVMQAYRSPR
jgi:3-hydroxyisobutyrate dehydrogenase